MTTHTNPQQHQQEQQQQQKQQQDDNRQQHLSDSNNNQSATTSTPPIKTAPTSFLPCEFLGASIKSLQSMQSTASAAASSASSSTTNSAPSSASASASASSSKPLNNSTISLFEESDADILERGLCNDEHDPTQYISNNNTPIPTPSATPSNEPLSINMNYILSPPPSIDLGGSAVDLDEDPGTDNDNDADACTDTCTDTCTSADVNLNGSGNTNTSPVSVRTLNRSRSRSLSNSSTTRATVAIRTPNKNNKGGFISIATSSMTSRSTSENAHNNNNENENGMTIVSDDTTSGSTSTSNVTTGTITTNTTCSQRGVTTPTATQTTISPMSTLRSFLPPLNQIEPCGDRRKNMTSNMTPTSATSITYNDTTHEDDDEDYGNNMNISIVDNNVNQYEHDHESGFEGIITNDVIEIDDIQNEDQITNDSSFILINNDNNTNNTDNHNDDDDDENDNHINAKNSFSSDVLATPTPTGVNQLAQSKSYHRRLHETAQFAEAIGEVPQEDWLLKIVIDDNDSGNESDDDEDDDDDDDNDGGVDNDNDNEDKCNTHIQKEANGDGDEVSDGNDHGNNDSKHNILEEISSENEMIGSSITVTNTSTSTSTSINDKEAQMMNVVPSVDNTVEIEESESVSERNSSTITTLSQGIFSIKEEDTSTTTIATTTKITAVTTTTSTNTNDLNITKANNTLPCGTKNENIVATIPPQQIQEKEQPQHQRISFPTLKFPTLNYFMHHLPCQSPEEKRTPTSSSPHQSSNDETNTHYVYKGIRHNPPEITKRGISRGNYAQLHRKAWLEVSDKYHRYGKNLRLYYKHWESLGHPTNMFFEWLDSRGEAAGWDKPNLKECPRSILDADRVLYITDMDDQARYLLKINSVEDRSRIDSSAADLSASSSTTSSTMSQLVDYKGDIVRTGPSGWIFVLRDHELYGAEKVTKIKSCAKSRIRFHHSSFFGGKAVAAAGILITDDNGCLKRLYPHSGHYRPGEAHMQRMLFYLYQSGVDLNTFEVDMQQIMHVSRELRDARTPKGGGCIESTKKAKKTDSLHLKNATFVALFLAHKAKVIRSGVLSKIHKIRSIHSSKRSVRNVLDVIDKGGYWYVQHS